MRSVLALACGVLAVGGACGNDDATDQIERHASAWEQVIRSVALAESAPVGEDDPLPVVFAHEISDDDTPAQVQVEVVNALIDEADVRFADDPDVVIDDSEDGEPVDDDGVLLTMQPPPETGDRITVEVERYRTADDTVTVDVVLTGGAPAWAVESVTPTG